MAGAIISYLAVANWSNSVPFFSAHTILLRLVGQRGGRGSYQRSEGAFRHVNSTLQCQLLSTEHCVNWTLCQLLSTQPSWSSSLSAPAGDIETQALQIFRLIWDEGLIRIWTIAEHRCVQAWQARAPHFWRIFWETTTGLWPHPPSRFFWK